MGNNLKSRLHLKKKDERPARTDTAGPKNEHTNPARTQVDQQIMSGPNRARQVEATASDTATASTTTRGVDTTQATTTARART
jgi:hypothetical protein